ncbi:alpha/beta hydrolase domain-containing protein [Yinghuangia sp. YIM S10712]|uniref:alpha/beta hydrolase domain-containing protein n=1 Tax=Yinghuangia sp. YIM S10712 TaxID=3436930 RepID=UPI003F53479A
MFSQAGQALRASAGTVFGKTPQAVLAEGESQSAHFLTTYINAIAPSARGYGRLGMLTYTAASACTRMPLATATSTSVPNQWRFDRVEADVDSAYGRISAHWRTTDRRRTNRSSSS